MTCADTFPCGVDGCHEEFGDPYELEDHKVKIHRARRRLKCSFCQIRFSCGRGLKEHERQVHYGEFKHRCSCSLGFQSGAHLTKHQEKCGGVAKTTYMSRLLKLVAEKDRRFEDDFEIERTEDGDEEIVGKSCSTVLKARSNRPGKCQKEYAVKRIEVLKDEPAEMRQATAKALTEALIAKQRCHHKNTVSAEAVYYDGNNVYIVSELIRPGSLEKVVLELDKKGKVVEEAHVASIMQDIAEALEYLRGEGIMHRDVKTANILIDLEAVAMLTDYGQSAIDGPVKLSCVGTRGFWAPEAARFLDEAQTHAVDIRPLGIVAAECLAQETVPTFTFDNAPEAVPVWLKRRLAHNNKPPPSDDFIDFIVKCLQKEPSKRPTAVQLLEHPLVRKATTESRQSLKELIACIL
ncbi:serine/threonine-protein kinase OSR1 [Aphelenchoides avenae]|nr:serine/threonine-protein kinase OSR1 [Aphelenchus avenae]